MQIEPQRLKYLLAVAQAGGVLAAAEVLHVTPSAVSQQLSRLESQLGRQLVIRTPQGATLTADGLTVAQAAEEIERTLNLALAKLAEDDVGPVGTVRIGGFNSFLRAILIPNIELWESRHPRLRFDIAEADHDILMRALRAGELDLVVAELDTGEAPETLPAGMTETPLLDEPWRLIVPRGTLLYTETPDLSSLPLPWLGVEASSAGATAMHRVSRAYKDAPTYAHRIQETQTTLALVAAGQGVALVPSLALFGMPMDDLESIEVPGIGMRRLVLRRYERRGTPEVVNMVAVLIREAASAFDFSASQSSGGRHVT